jgi:hypothetical protein
MKLVISNKLVILFMVLVYIQNLVFQYANECIFFYNSLRFIAQLSSRKTKKHGKGNKNFVIFHREGENIGRT